MKTEELPHERVQRNPAVLFSVTPHWNLHYYALHVAIGRNPMSASSSPSLPRTYLHSVLPQHLSLLSAPSPSPPGPLYTRLSNGSHSAHSSTNSRSSFHGVSFLLQIGLTRETVNLEASDLSLSAVKDLVCSIVDQKVRLSSYSRFPLFFKLCRTFPIKPSFSNILWNKRFYTNTCMPTKMNLFLNFSSNPQGSRALTWWCTDICFAFFYHIHLFRFCFQSKHLGLVPQNESNTAEACTQQH